MARIAGVDLPKNKRTEIALTYIYGIGKSTSQQILDQAGIDPNLRVKDLTEEDATSILLLVRLRTPGIGHCCGRIRRDRRYHHRYHGGKSQERS